MILAGKTGDVSIKAAARPADPWQSYAPTLSTETFAGRSVTPEMALAISAVYGSVSLVSQTCGTLPCETLKADSKGNTLEVKDNNLSRMLRYKPNRDMPASVLWTLAFSHILLRGNSYLAKLRDNRGFVAELYPIRPEYVTPFRDENGDKKFRVRIYSGTTFVDHVFGPEDILHLMGPSFDDGLLGASPIGVMRNRLGVQLAQSEYQARFYQEGAAIKGTLSVQGQLTKESADRLRGQWREAYGGVGNSHKIAVLEQGANFSPVSISPEDQQLIQQMRWGATEIATAYGIPASRINAEGASLTYTNSIQDDLHFFKSAIYPRLKLVEDCLNCDPDLFGVDSPWFPRFDIDAVLRADIKTRYEIYAMGRTSGFESPNTILAQEGRPAREGGDVYEDHPNTRWTVTDQIMAEPSVISSGEEGGVPRPQTSSGG